MNTLPDQRGTAFQAETFKCWLCNKVPVKNVQLKVVPFSHLDFENQSRLWPSVAETGPGLWESVLRTFLGLFSSLLPLQNSARN